MNMINCIFLVMLLLVSMVLLKRKNFPQVINFLHFIRLFHLQLLSIINLPVSFAIFVHPQHLMITLAKILFLLFYKLECKNCFLCTNTRVRGGSRTAKTSEMERVVIIANGWKPLTIITKRSILDAAAVLDPSLRMQ